MASSILSNGLLGMGGFGLGGNNMPSNSLLGEYYDPAEMRKYQMKQMLLGMGAGLMAEKGYGKGAELALVAGDRAGNQYRENAMDAYKLKQAQDEQEYQRGITEQNQARADAEFGFKKSEFDHQKKLWENPPPAPLPNEIQLYQYAQQNPDFGQYQLEMKKAGGTNIDNRQMGTIPPGYAAEYDDQNRVIGLRPIPGGPAAAEVNKIDSANTAKAGKQETITGTVSRAADEARKLISGWSTGLVGQGLSGIGVTDAAEVNRQVHVLQSVASIETLTAMRRESPTGGALGAVSDKENAMLAAAAGALDPSAGPERFAKALDNYELTLLQIIHGPDVGTQLFNQKKAAGEAQSQQSGAPTTQAPNLKQKYGLE